MPLDATWNITVQWLAGDIACRTLVPETSGHVCRSFPACGHWARPPGSCTPPVWSALGWKEAAWGSLGTQPPARLTPAVPVPYRPTRWSSSLHSVSPKAASRLDGKRPSITSSPSASSFCCH
ncbi:unnamed protein product [Rangifer tarandus platyrhynchus]|uniref:Uncharacterized protein n=1 Tax=Rangifer tarandus platyrhynchus TaxID=3082113 RepID=A0AC59Y0D9_RANTA